jgi:Fic family protein
LLRRRGLARLLCYRLLSAVRADGDWEAWVAFFLEAVAAAAAEAERAIVDIASLVNADRRRLLAAPRVGAVALRLFEVLPVMPRFTIEHVRQELATTFPTATAAVKLLEETGIVTELTGQKKNRSFSYRACVDLLTR